jgi:hypothetical protein
MLRPSPKASHGSHPFLSPALELHPTCLPLLYTSNSTGDGTTQQPSRLTSVAQQTAGLCLPSGREGTNAYASPKAIPVSVSSPSPPLSLARACEHLVIALPCHPCSTSTCRALRRRCSLRASTASRSFLPSAARMFGR